MGIMMYLDHYSILSIIWGAVEIYILLGFYGSYLLDLSTVIALIIPTMAMNFYLLITDCNKRSTKSKCNFCYSVFLGQLLLKSNDIMFYGTVGVMLAYYFPVNSFVVTYLTKFSVSQAQRILLMLIAILQLIGILVLLAIPIQVNKQMVTISKRLQTTLFCMDKQNFRLKWKYLSQLEFIQSRPQIGYTLTPYGAITFSLIIEVCIQTIVPNKFYSFCLNFFSY